MITTFPDALHFLYSFISYERDAHWTYNQKTFNLDRFRDFLASLGSPQQRLRTIHVAGSDGKGSTCAMLAAVLQQLGYHTGLFTSPHLHTVRERIQVNREWINKSRFIHWTQYLETQLETMPPRRGGFATFFELITAMAYLHFQAECTDFSVIETGLGGRLDSTNVMSPVITVITHLSLEHTEQLGNTLEAIAEEKLGILRPDAPVVIGHQDPALLPYLKERLRGHPQPVVFTDEVYACLRTSIGRHWRTLTVQGPGELVRTIHLPLLGHYQLQNAVTAMATLDLLVERDVLPPISAHRLDTAMRSVAWPGRFEILRRPGMPKTILDIAHTAKGAASLRLSLDEVIPRARRWFVLGFLRDKKYREMIEHLVRESERVFFTQPPTPRALSLDDLRRGIAELHLPNESVRFVESPLEAYAEAVAAANKKDVIVVAGSLYLVGEIRRHCLEVQENDGL